MRPEHDQKNDEIQTLIRKMDSLEVACQTLISENNALKAAAADCIGSLEATLVDASVSTGSSCHQAPMKNIAGGHIERDPANLIEQVNQGFRRRSAEGVRAAYEQHKDPRTHLIMPNMLGPALKTLGWDVHAMSELLEFADLNKDGGLDFQEFSLLLAKSTPIEEWAGTLPLAQIVADALPRNDCRNKEQLRYLSRISRDQLEESCVAITEGVRRALHEQLAALKEAFERLDGQEAAASNASKKFQICKMSVGDISNFHQGLAARIGDYYLDHPDEH